MRLVLGLAALLAVAACQPWDAPNESPSRTVEGCEDAVAYLRACCPRYDSYISCTYMTHAVASPDLTTSESRCLTRKSCADVERAVVKNDRICGVLPASNHCR